MTMEEITHDTQRVKYFQEYIRNAVEAAVHDNVSTSSINMPLVAHRKKLDILLPQEQLPSF